MREQMICTVCDTVSDYDDCLRFTRKWNDDFHMTESFVGLRCPECGAEGEFLTEVVVCERCHMIQEPDTKLIAGRICQSCFDWIVKNHVDLVSDFLKEENLCDEFAEFALEKL